MNVELLREQIRAAFPPEPFYGTITTCDCKECTEIREELRCKQWDQVPTAVLDFRCNTVLLTPEAFNTFLPAYLLRALDDLSSTLTEMTVYELCPPVQSERPDQAIVENLISNHLRERVRTANPAQVGAIRKFLLFVQDNAPDAKWFRPLIKRALEEVWT